MLFYSVCIIQHKIYRGLANLPHHLPGDRKPGQKHKWHLMEDGGGSFFKPLVFVCSTLCDSELCVRLWLDDLWDLADVHRLYPQFLAPDTDCIMFSRVESVNIRDWDVVILVVTGLEETPGHFRQGVDIEQSTVAGRQSVTGQFTRMMRVRPQ